MSLKNPLSDPLYDCIFTVEGAGLTKEQKSVDVYVLEAQVSGGGGWSQEARLLSPVQPVAQSTHLLTCIPSTLNPKPECPQVTFQLTTC